MSNTNFTIVLRVDESPQEVFNAICNVRGWWQGEIEGNTDQLNDEFTYRMKEFHYSKQKLIEMVPDKKIIWLVTESQLNFIKDEEEWTGTKIIFEISKNNDQTELRFTHAGLTPGVECYGDCSKGWTGLIQKSLRSLITTGRGVDVF